MAAAERAEKSADYTNVSQQNLLAVVEAMARTWPLPQSTQALAQSAGVSRDQAFRCAWNLQAGGWADQGPEGWLLSPHLAELSNRMRLALADLHRRYLSA